ncbi:MAG: DMT family transporter, partial [Alphaproteobacteria bacterium]|nr:DMT family transporter [Alphaproteobacteria bacterium]
LPSAYALLAGIIISGFLSQFFKNNAYKHGEISFLSPLIYFNIVWATLLGWAVWKEIPEIHVYIGCAIIICSNLLITWKEQKIARNDV